MGNERRRELLPVLQEIQEKEGYLSRKAIEETASRLDVPVSEVYGVAAFYSDLKLSKEDIGEKDTEFKNKNVLLDLSPVKLVLRDDKENYRALKEALTVPPEEIIDLLKASGLKGRGGANFPTGIKWESAFRQEADEKYIVCNANEGDPGVFMDRYILAHNPGSVIEGILIAGYATGASKGIIYLREKSPNAEAALRKEIDKVSKEGILGRNIFGSEFSFELELRIGSGAYVSGEETALLASIEGRRAEPALKPPYPFQDGLFHAPTTIDNVETLANVAPIILKGAKYYKSLGNDNNAGTKVLAVSGDVEKEGVLEVPFGTPLSEVIAMCGGIRGGKKLKAVFAGGPSGGAITEEHLDTPIDYPSFAALGAAVGSGGIEVYDDSRSMVQVAKDFADFSVAESCGKCSVCRIGMKRIADLLGTFVDGTAQAGDIEKLKHLAENVKAFSRCGLGQTAPNPVLSTIENFRSEYEAGIASK